jgi:hypothetical protein
MIDGIFGVARAEGVSGLYKVTAAPPCTVKSGCRKHEFDDSSFVSFVSPSLSFALRSTPSSSSSELLTQGLGPAWIATIPGTGSSYVVYELAKTIFGIRSN